MQRLTFLGMIFPLFMCANAMGQDDLKLPNLPKGITSFGAAVCDGFLYVYGGNEGGAHGYSNESQSNTFRRIKLANGAEWESLGEVPRRQGNALLSHDGLIYQIGGFEALNNPGDEENKMSRTDFRAYNPDTQKWDDSLPPLPEPRSSFDAVVMGDSIYVVGGWQLRGDEDSVWHTTAWQIDLSAKPLEWKPLPEPPFTRRANSVCFQGGKIYVIGGMNEQGATSDVEVLDLESETWSHGPGLPGESMAGFGNSSFNVGGNIIVTMNDGQSLQLSDDGSEWKPAAKVASGRMFHRLVAFGDDRFIVLGGGAMRSGKKLEIEVIEK